MSETSVSEIGAAGGGLDPNAIIQPFEYKLRKPLKYTHGGAGEREAGFIMLYEPAGKHAKTSLLLEQMFKRALDEQTARQAEMMTDEMREEMKTKARAEIAAKQEEATPGQEFGFTGAEVLAVVSGSRNELLSDFVELVRAMLCGTGLAMIDDSEKLTSTLCQNLSLADLRGLAGAYFAGFILPSVLESITDNG